MDGLAPALGVERGPQSQGGAAGHTEQPDGYEDECDEDFDDAQPAARTSEGRGACSHGVMIGANFSGAS
ncbi:MAG: hypothetical protein JWM95_3443, partial [Gemmatimonadetes bacterium]|nr:hypothetical protein [Gemmatimonadota bacterium]